MDSKIANTIEFVKKSKKQFIIITAVFIMYILMIIALEIILGGQKYLFAQRLLVGSAIFMVTMISYFWLRIRDTKTNLIDLIIRYRYILAIIYFVTFCALGIHGFSVDQWSAFLESESEFATKIFGANRGITSDAWAIGIPQILNQIKTGFPLFNETIMTDGANTVLSGLPALDFTLIGQPHYWGCLFGEYIGLAWLYWFKIFALLLNSYEVMNFLLRDKKRMALLGAGVITFSPLMSWWLGHTVVLVVIYMHWCVSCVIMYTKNINNLLKKLSAVILGVVGFIGFIICWYPALQVPFSYLAIILIIAVLYRNYQEKNKFRKSDIVIICGGLLCAVAIMVRFIWISKDSIASLIGTAFPGERFITGGGYSLYYAGYYLFQPLFAGKHPILVNECEASTIMPFLPIALLAVIIIIIVIKMKKQSLKEHTLMISLFLYEVFLLSWLFFSYPAWFAKYTLFSNVTESRMIWCIAVISVYLGFITLCYIWEKIHIKKIIAFAFSIAISLLFYIIIKPYMDYEFLNFYGIPAIVVIIVVFTFYTLFNYLFLSGMKKTIVMLLSIMCIGYFLTINPLQMGTYAITDNIVSKTITEIAAEEEDSYWIYEGDLEVGNFVYGNFISSHGVDTFNATNQYMDKKKWSILDINGEYEEVYNRYAQVCVEIVYNGTTTIELKSADLVFVQLTIEDLKNLGIDFIMTTRNLETINSDIMKFELVLYDKISRQRIYKAIYY